MEPSMLAPLLMFASDRVAGKPIDGSSMMKMLMGLKGGFESPMPPPVPGQMLDDTNVGTLTLPPLDQPFSPPPQRNSWLDSMGSWGVYPRGKN